MAMNSTTGKPIWWRNVAYLYRAEVPAMPKGSGPVWPSPSGGIMAYSAFDEKNVYVAVNNQGMNFFSKPGEGHVEPAFESMKNGIGNGSITALDLNNGKVRWEHKTDFPTWVSPLVTNGVVFSGTITAVGNKETGVTYPIGIGGPSIGNGILLVPTGNIAEVANPGGYIVAFGLPEE